VKRNGSSKKSGRKLRVAHLLDCYLALSEVFIYELIRNLRSVDSYVVAREVRNVDKFPFERVFHTKGDGRNWRERVRERLVSRSPYDMMRAEPVLRSEGADVLHAHFGLLGARSLSLARKLGVPLVTSFYGVDASRQAAEPANRGLFKELFEGGDLFLAEGSAMKSRLIDLGIPHSKIAIQHLGVDIDRLQYIERNLPQEGEPARVLFCGRFVEKKGLVDALGAVKIALSKGVKCEFRVIGDGPMREEVEKFIEENSLSRHVTLLGMLDHSSYKREIASAHILLQPSKTAPDGDTEGGAPTVLLEAQAAGLPVISTTHADIPEYVKDREGGILLHEGDVVGIAEALESLIRNPKHLRSMGRLGRIHVVENYNICNETEKLGGIYMDVYRDTMKERDAMKEASIERHDALDPV